MAARCSHAGLRSRRAFTLLETVLAAAIGSIVVTACLGIFVLLERTDRLLETRARDQAELQRLRLVMSRTFSSLLLSDAPRPIAEDPDAASTDNAANRARLAARRTKFDPNAPPPAERLTLAVDGGLTQSMAVNQGQGVAAQAFSPQRLEVVLFESPVPTSREFDPLNEDAMARVGDRIQERAARSESTSATGTTNTGGPSADKGSPRSTTRSGNGKQTDDSGSGPSPDAESTADDAAETEALVESVAMPVRAVRGAFEMRPQAVTQHELAVAASRAEGTGPLAWEMWWVPLQPRASSLDSTPLPSGQPFRVASNLKYARWRFFDDRQRKDVMSATWTQQLPAYVELEVETTGGLMANWMFEVDWAIGPEIAVSRAQPVEAERTDQPAGETPEGSTPKTEPPPEKASKGKGGRK